MPAGELPAMGTPEPVTIMMGFVERMAWEGYSLTPEEHTAVESLRLLAHHE
jgi:hypothetical protein